ncbi:MAG: hypothetical protein H7A33_00875 [Deltaproteobacteria bacterium]|nr:hypothetical protein [Deltaproteobacteria bacterium]
MSLSLRDKAFFLLVLKDHPQNAVQYFSYLNTQLKSQLQKLYDQIASLSHENIKAVAHSELMRLVKRQSQTYLNDVHDDWLVEILLKESPAMVAIVLRYLPVDRAKRILDRLPPEVSSKMPKMKKTFSVSPILLLMLQQRFENLFAVDRVYRKGETLEMNHLPLLGQRKVQQVFLNLGYRELSLGLRTLPEGTRSIMLKRFPAEVRSAVADYLKKGDRVSPERIKLAQQNVSDAQDKQSSGKEFVMGLGFVVFSKSILAKEESDLGIIEKMFPLVLAKQLRKLAQEQMGSNTEASALAYREEVIAAMTAVLQN